ncbi:hypothetical protein K488DRAFT_92587 [Vararia minispora EC-137]|uniref:Uncharacterized protein n=1 Tax=Vararia minispora EC-137 TaxID=1314806 RepID=A0ACB8Q3Z9_9AGAM|nr:hypothetical protein K488DRAFT_92587 [Vararia minispora EC-137]
MRRSRLIQRRDRRGQQEAAAKEETDIVLDIRRATIVEGGEDIVQGLDPVLAAGVHTQADLHVRPLPRPPSRPRGMRPMPVRSLPGPPVAQPGHCVGLAAITEESERGDGREELERADGRDERELLRILGLVIGDLPLSPVQDHPRLPETCFSLGPHSMNRAVARHSIDPSGATLAYFLYA